MVRQYLQLIKVGFTGTAWAAIMCGWALRKRTIEEQGCNIFAYGVHALQATMKQLLRTTRPHSLAVLTVGGRQPVVAPAAAIDLAISRGGGGTHEHCEPTSKSKGSQALDLGGARGAARVASVRLHLLPSVRHDHLGVCVCVCVCARTCALTRACDI